MYSLENFFKTDCFLFQTGELARVDCFMILPKIMKFKCEFVKQ